MKLFYLGLSSGHGYAFNFSLILIGYEALLGIVVMVSTNSKFY